MYDKIMFLSREKLLLCTAAVLFFLFLKPASFYSSVDSTQKTSASIVTSDGSTQKPSTAGETTQSRSGSLDFKKTILIFIKGLFFNIKALYLFVLQVPLALLASLFHWAC